MSIQCFDWSKMAAEGFPVARIDEYAKPYEPAIHVLRSVITTRKWSLACALKRNSDDWLGSPMPHIPKNYNRSSFRIFFYIHVMLRRHALQTKDVFLGILTKTGWWIRRPDFYLFSLWFHLKFPIKNNHTSPITKLYKTKYSFSRYYFM